MFEKLEAAEKRYEELYRLMANPEVATDPDRLREYAQERADLEDLVQTYREVKAAEEELAATEAMLDDEQDEAMVELIQEEIEALQGRKDSLLEEIKLLLVPRDPRDKKDVIMEIRAGTGGEEAALFAADLYRMYAKYGEKHGWRAEVLSAHPTGIGGFKEIIFEVKGKGAYSHLKYESGVHRVQRVPITEASGRIHTSTATVAVLPEMEEVEVKVDPNDLRMDVYGSSGPGGQHMQKNATAVRITHLPTGLVVACESERSQFQNRAHAMAVLRAKLYEMEEQKRLEEVGAVRRAQVGTGERAEKIRTYNFPQNRVTDHRIGKTSYQLGSILEGELDEFIEELATADRAEKLQVVGIS
jgi:peptide chain release factor 1